MYLHGPMRTAENTSGTAIDAHRASSTDWVGCVCLEKYSVRHRSTQKAEM